MSQLLGKAKEFVADKIAHVQKPEADITDMSINHVTKNSAIFNANLDVSNPYSHTIPICEISYTLKSGGRVVVSGTMADPGSLKGEDTTKLVVPMKVPYDFVISIMKDMGRDWDIDYELVIGLTIDLPVVGNFTVPVSKKGEMKLPTLSDIF